MIDGLTTKNMQYLKAKICLIKVNMDVMTSSLRMNFALLKDTIEVYNRDTENKINNYHFKNTEVVVYLIHQYL